MYLNLYIRLQGWTNYVTGWRTFLCELYPHIVCVRARACVNTQAILTLDSFIDEGTPKFAREASCYVVLQRSLKRF